MRYVESKKFVFSRPPTGYDIEDLIREHDLHGWTLDINQRHLPANNISLNNYVYDVVFSKGTE